MLWTSPVNCLRGRRALWFLLLFAVGGLVLFFKPLSEIIQQQYTGMELGSAPQQPTEDRRGRSDQSRQTASPDDPGQDIGSLRVSSTTTDSFSPESWKKISDIQERRKQLVKETCAKYKSNIPKEITPLSVQQLFVEDKHKLLYCHVYKAGSSNWKRTLLVLAGKFSNIQNIKHEEAQSYSNLRTLNSFNHGEIMHRLKTYTKVIFVREPFERTLSAFRDKFNNPAPNYHRHYGIPLISKYRDNPSQEALKTGDGLMFKEFVKFLIDDNRPVPGGLDIHWNLVNNFCNPCVIDYDFFGKFENMEEESNFVLQMVGAPPNIKVPSFKDRNPSDKKTTSDITEKYFSQVSQPERQKLYDFYYLDYLMFNYSKPFNDLF